MSAHPVLSGHPAYAEWEAERQQLAERRESLAGQMQAAHAKRRDAEEVHARKVESATRAGKPIPARPKPADTGHLAAALGVQERDERAHRERRGVVLADAADELSEALKAGERERWERWQAIAPEIAALDQEHRDAAALARQLLAASDRRASVHVRPSRADRVEVRSAWPDLLAAALTGGTMLDPQPLSPVAEPRIQVDHDSADSPQAGMARAIAAGDAGPGRLGYGEGGRFGNRDLHPERSVQIWRP